MGGSGAMVLVPLKPTLKATNLYLRRIIFLSLKDLLQIPVTFLFIIKNQFVRLIFFHTES